MHTENRLVKISDTSFILTGMQVPNPSVDEFNNDVLLLILNINGELYHEYSYGSMNVTEGIKSLIFNSDTLYATGFYNVYGLELTQTFLWLFSSSCDSLALFTYGHPTWNFIGNKIIRAQNGDFIIAGYAQKDGNYDRLLLRIAPDGNYFGIKFLMALWIYLLLLIIFKVSLN